MRVKYIGLSDNREVKSSDHPSLDLDPDMAWVQVWQPEQVHEVPDEVGQFLVGHMKNEFRDVTEYNTDAELNAQAEAEAQEEPAPEPAGDAFWDLPQDEDNEVQPQPGWLDSDDLDTSTTKSVLQQQMRFREMNPEGMTRRAMLDAISEHDERASSQEPQEGEGSPGSA